MYNEYFINLTDDDIEGCIRNPHKFSELFMKYVGTNNKHANTLLDAVLDEEEKDYLGFLLHSKKGWFCSFNNEGARLLKLAAEALGLTHNKYSDKEEEYKATINVGMKLSEEKFDLLLDVYIKQKLVTGKTLSNKYVQEKEVRIVRGLRLKGISKNYETSNLECWTTDVNVARKFAGYNGYIINRKIKIHEVFISPFSIFIPKNFVDLPSYKYFIPKDEKEYIIENKQCLISLVFGQNINDSNTF